MEQLTILVLFVIIAGFSVILFKMMKRISILESHLDVTMAHTQTINDIFQKSIIIIKDALIDFDNRINLSKNIIMASVDNNKITIEGRLTKIEMAEKNNNSILQQEIRTVRAMVDKMSENLAIQLAIADEIKVERNKLIYLKNMIDGYLVSMGKKFFPHHHKK